MSVIDVTFRDVSTTELTMPVLWVKARSFPEEPPPGWVKREIPYWMLSAEPGNLTMVCYVSKGGTVMLKKND